MLPSLRHADVPPEANAVARAAVDTAVKVQTTLGPGLVEKAYKACVVHRLRRLGYFVETEVWLPLVFDDEIVVDRAFRPDCIVDRRVILEFKVAETIAPIHQSQILTYLRITGCPIGLVLNFGEVPLGISRKVHTSR